MSSGFEDVRTGAGRAGLVRAEMRGVGRTRPAEKANAKVMEEKKNTEEKENWESNK